MVTPRDVANACYVLDDNLMWRCIFCAAVVPAGMNNGVFDYSGMLFHLRYECGQKTMEELAQYVFRQVRGANTPSCGTLTSRTVSQVNTVTRTQGATLQTYEVMQVQNSTPRVTQVVDLTEGANVGEIRGIQDNLLNSRPRRVEAGRAMARLAEARIAASEVSALIDKDEGDDENMNDAFSSDEGDYDGDTADGDLTGSEEEDIVESEESEGTFEASDGMSDEETDGMMEEELA